MGMTTMTDNGELYKHTNEIISNTNIFDIEKAKIPNYALILDLTDGIYTQLLRESGKNAEAYKRELKVEATTLIDYVNLYKLVKEYYLVKATAKTLFTRRSRKEKLKNIEAKVIRILLENNPRTYISSFKRVNLSGATERFINDYVMKHDKNADNITREEIKAKLLLLKDIQSKTFEELVEYVKQ